MHNIIKLDPDTHEILEAALNCLVSLSDAQVTEEGADAIMAIVEALALRFGIEAVEAEIHSSEDGDEIIYKPRGAGLFPDE